MEEGDIVSIDVGACVGFEGIDPKTSCHRRVPRRLRRYLPGGAGGRGGPAAHRRDGAELLGGHQACPAGKRISDISRGVQTYVEANGFSVVREYVGHGVGAQMHEAPEVPNYVMTRRLGGDPRLVKNMTIAVEPWSTRGPYTSASCPTAGP